MNKVSIDTLQIDDQNMISILLCEAIISQISNPIRRDKNSPLHIDAEQALNEIHVVSHMLLIAITSFLGKPISKENHKLWEEVGHQLIKEYQQNPKSFHQR